MPGKTQGRESRASETVSGGGPRPVDAVRRVAIVGVPNTGKSSVFSRISGRYSVVANYPLTTVEPKRAFRTLSGQRYEFIDTPGLHCLYIHSEEELEVRDLLFSEPPDILVQCIDANRLRQSLELTLDLVELGIPLVISLNAIDETQRNGLLLDSRSLGSFLGVEVVETVTTRARGTEELERALPRARPPSWRPLYGAVLEEAIEDVEAALPEETPFRRKTAELVLLEDPYILAGLGRRCGDGAADRARAAAEAAGARAGVDLGRAFRARLDKLLDHAVSRASSAAPRPEGRAGRTLASLARHPVFGVPILLGIVAVMYVLVVHGAGAIARLLDRSLAEPVVEWVRRIVVSPLLEELLIGDFGLLTLGLFNALLTVLPVLGLFYIAMGVLEDVGYLPNITLLLRKFLGRIGLSGRSVMSLVLGFGCKTMASLTTRGITSRRERIIANTLIAFAIPCSAQLALDMTILGRTGVTAFVVAVAYLALVELGAGALLNRLLPREPVMEYIQELPPIRVPRPGAVLVKTGHRLAGFLEEAFPIFVIAAVALFALEKLGVLHAVEGALRPVVVGWLGLPIRMVEVLILSLARHEAAAGLLLGMVDAGHLDFTQTIVAVTVTTMFVPCLANIVAMCRVLGPRTGLLVTLGVNVVAFALGGALRWAITAVLALL